MVTIMIRFLVGRLIKGFRCVRQSWAGVFDDTISGVVFIVGVSLGVIATPAGLIFWSVEPEGYFTLWVLVLPVALAWPLAWFWLVDWYENPPVVPTEGSTIKITYPKWYSACLIKWSESDAEVFIIMLATVGVLVALVVSALDVDVVWWCIATPIVLFLMPKIMGVISDHIDGVKGQEESDD